jgi:hypothetical protein
MGEDERGRTMDEGRRTKEYKGPKKGKAGKGGKALGAATHLLWHKAVLPSLSSPLASTPLFKSLLLTLTAQTERSPFVMAKEWRRLWDFSLRAQTILLSLAWGWERRVSSG